MKLVDLSYYTYADGITIADIKNRNMESLGYIHFMQVRNTEIVVINHMQNEGSSNINGIPFKAFKGKNSFFHIPRQTHQYIKSHNPDVVMVQGLIFPLQVIALRFALGKRCKIIVQHHGEQLARNFVKNQVQKLADKCIDAYLFTSKGNAVPWVKEEVICSMDKCYEVLEASTYLSRQDKKLAKLKTGISGPDNFLWVGRLNKGKDPLTVLKGFYRYTALNPSAKLYMIYQDENLLADVKTFINESGMTNVFLIGRVEKEELALWYSAADFFISGSHHEGSGYALIESMACGCIPVVTDIPPFRTITGDGKFGLLFKPGDSGSLYHLLMSTGNMNRNEFSDSVKAHFENNLSFKSIADDIYGISARLVAGGK